MFLFLFLFLFLLLLLLRWENLDLKGWGLRNACFSRLWR